MFRYRLVSLLLAASLPACAAGNGPPSPPAGPTNTPVSAASQTPLPGTPAPSASPTITATPDLTLPPGLMLVTGDLESKRDLWIADRAGKLRHIADTFGGPGLYPDFDVSPDGTQILYRSGYDIWLLDAATGQTRNVTQTPDRMEIAPRWWPGHPGSFVCGSVEDMFGESVGMLTLVGPDGSYRVLDNAGVMPSIPAPRPTGDIILYTKYGKRTDKVFDVWAYVPGKGSYRLAASELGIEEITSLDIPTESLRYGTGSLSWSPDGGTLGLAVFGQFDGEPKAGILTVDWATRKASAPAMTFAPVAIGGPLFGSAPRFPAHGDWFVFEAWDESLPNGRVYMSDGSGVHDLTGEVGLGGQFATYPAISPDAAWVAILTGGDLGLIDTKDWKLQTISFPERVSGVGWVAPPR